MINSVVAEMLFKVTYNNKYTFSCLTQDMSAKKQLMQFDSMMNRISKCLN